MNRYLRGIAVFCVAWSLFACSAEMTEAEYVAKAKDFLGKGELRAASIETKNALRKNPDNAEARWLLGRLHLDSGDAVAAEKELLRARKLGVSEESARPLLARALYMQGKHDDLQALSLNDLSASGQSVVLVAQSLSLLPQGRVEEATSHLDKALSLDPYSGYARVARARLLATKQEYQLAREELKGVLDSQPEDAEAWSLLADIELQEGHLEQAELAYTKAIEVGVNRLADRLKRAQLHIQRNKYGEAQKDIDALKERAPQHAVVNYTQGLLHYQQKNLPEALSAFERAVASNSSYLPAVYYLSLTHLRLGNLSQAEQYGRDFLVAVPDSDSGRKLMAMISLGTQQYKKAEELLRPLMASDDKDLAVLNLLANALLSQGKTDEGIELLQKVVSLQPDSAVAQLRLGAGLLAGGETGGGVEHLEAALESNPQFQQADMLLVLNYLQQKKIDQALIAAQAYRERHPETVSPYNLLGRVYLAAGRDSEAQEAFAKACAIAPGDPTGCQSLATLALNSRDFDKARGYYQEILQYHENYLPILIKLAALDALENKPEAMVEHLQQAIKAHPQAPAPRVLLARYHLTQGRPEQVPGLLSELGEAQKKGPEVLETMALSQLARKSFSQAKFTLEQLIEIQPNSAHAHYQLAQAYAGLNDSKQVKAELKMAVELAPESVPPRLAFARILLREGDKEAAGEQLQRLRELAPENPEVLQIEASVANMAGDQAAALKKTELAFEKYPQTSGMLLLARQKWAMGDRAGSLQLQEQWGSEHPDDIPARLALADVYILENRINDAIKQFQLVLSKDDKNLVALNNLAWYLRDSQPGDALAYAKRANDIKPESSALMDTLAVVLLNNGEVEKARRMIERVLVKMPSNPTIRYHSAMINAAAGERKLATKMLTLLLEDDASFPEKTDAEQLLEKLRSSE